MRITCKDEKPEPPVTLQLEQNRAEVILTAHNDSIKQTLMVFREINEQLTFSRYVLGDADWIAHSDMDWIAEK